MTRNLRTLAALYAILTERVDQADRSGFDPQSTLILHTDDVAYLAELVGRELDAYQPPKAKKARAPKAEVPSDPPGQMRRDTAPATGGDV